MLEKLRGFLEERIEFCQTCLDFYRKQIECPVGIYSWRTDKDIEFNSALHDYRYCLKLLKDVESDGKEIRKKRLKNLASELVIKCAETLLFGERKCISLHGAVFPTMKIDKSIPTEMRHKIEDILNELKQIYDEINEIN